MGVPKRLTERQIAFVDLRVGNTEITATEAAIRAGYPKSSARMQASRLQNPNYSPLVVDYIEKLRTEKSIKNREDLNNAAAKLMSVTASLIEDMEKEPKNRKVWLPKLKKVAKTFNSYNEAQKIIVYFARENRLDTNIQTNYIKIGKTTTSVEERSASNVTDSPFPLNYFACVEYYPNRGFNLEHALHYFFRKWNVYDNLRGGTEWFDLNKFGEERLVKVFKKVSEKLCKKHNCCSNFKKL